VSVYLESEAGITQIDVRNHLGYSITGVIRNLVCTETLRVALAMSPWAMIDLVGSIDESIISPGFYLE
jgi:hypothetical protein